MPGIIPGGPFHARCVDKTLTVVYSVADRHADAEPTPLKGEKPDDVWSVGEDGDAGIGAELIDGYCELRAQERACQRFCLAQHGMPYGNVVWPKLAWPCYRDLHLTSPLHPSEQDGRRLQSTSLRSPLALTHETGVLRAPGWTVSCQTHAAMVGMRS